MSNKNVNILKILFCSMSLFMAYLAVTTSIKSNLFALPESLTQAPWFITTLWDFYFNITIISVWVIYKEKSLVQAIVWVIAFIFLGSIATTLYVFLQLKELKPGEGVEKVLLRNV